LCCLCCSHHVCLSNNLYFLFSKKPSTLHRYSVFLPVVLALTIVRDSRFLLGAPESEVTDETSALLDAPVNQPSPQQPASPAAANQPKQRKSVAFQVADKVTRKKFLLFVF
jgi:hypothetical protein